MANIWDSTIGTDLYKDTLTRTCEIAEKSGYLLNPDLARVQKVVGLMTMNLMDTGYYYCPCKQSHPLNTKKDVLCPCPGIKKEIDSDGMCFCRLFFKKAD